MRVVLDTNVLVSGLLSPHGPCAAILRMVSSGELILCLDARLLSEYAEVLSRPKFGFDGDDVSLLLMGIEQTGHVVAPAPLAGRLPDPGGEPFLEIALSSQAECLVTGNGAHYPSGLRQGMPVLSPAEFVAAYRDADAGV